MAEMVKQINPSEAIQKNLIDLMFAHNFCSKTVSTKKERKYQTVIKYR